MSKQELEQRVAELEKKVVDLETALANGVRIKDPMSTFGMFKGDELARRVDEQILAAREKERREARRRTAQPRNSRRTRGKA